MFIDYRDEFYVKSYRCLLIIDALGLNSRGDSVLTLEKAAFVDYLLKNPDLFDKVLSRFCTKKRNKKCGEVLYQTNAEFGDLHDTQSFLKTVLVLENSEHIDLKKQNGDIYLLKKHYRDFVFNDLALFEDLKLLKPLLSKSMNILHRSVLERET